MSAQTHPIPDATRRRLAKLLAMLGSEHAGERDAAGLAAHRLVQKCGADWGDLLTLPRVYREPLQSTWRNTCAALIERAAELRPWERKFVADLPNFQRRSTKQRYVLFEISDRVLKTSSSQNDRHTDAEAFHARA